MYTWTTPGPCITSFLRRTIRLDKLLVVKHEGSEVTCIFEGGVTEAIICESAMHAKDLHHSIRDSLVKWLKGEKDEA